MHRKGRFLAGILACSLTFSLWGCGADLSGGKEKSTADQAEESQTDEDAASWKKASSTPYGKYPKSSKLLLAVVVG